MSRPIPPDRFARLVSVAADVFIEQGYRRTQMEDVAEALGVGKGTLYGYVESKTALFDAVARHADGHDPVPGPDALPWKTPAAGSTVSYLRERLANESSGLVLLDALGRSCSRDGAAELADVVRDLHRRLARSRRTIKLVDRCAADHPELAAVWFDEGRWAQHAALAHYLERRIAEGALRPVTSVPIAARFVLETIAFWAVHRHWDPSPQALVEEEVESTLVELVLRGLGKEPP